jgi:PilZ domain
MDAYEFYWRDSTKGYELIGVLPERRKNPARRTQESVINLARGLLGHGVNVNRIFFIKATRDENTGKILRLDSVYRQLKEYFEDRRRHPRISVDLPLEYRMRHDAHAQGAILTDASEGGFLIHSIRDIPIGTKLRIAVLFPKDYELAIFEVFAETIRKEFAVEQKSLYQQGYQYGLKIIHILEEDCRKLRGLLNARFK